MPIELIEKTKDLNVVPEGLRSLYIEKDGEHVLDVAAALANQVAAATAAVEHNRRTILEEKKKLEAKVQGIDLDKAKELLAAEAERAGKKAKAEGDWDARERQLIQNHTTELQKEKDRTALILKALEDNLVRAAAVAAISNAKGSVEVLLPHVMGRLKMVEREDGKFVAQVMTTEGQPAFKDGKATPMAIEDLVGDFKKNKLFAPNFQADAGSGSGAAADGNRGGPEGDAALANLPPTERLKAVRRSNRVATQ